MVLENILQKYAQPYMEKDVSRSIDLNNEKLETTKMSIHRGITKKIVLHYIMEYCVAIKINQTYQNSTIRL